MKLQITWEGNTDGAQRTLLLPGHAVRLWIYVLGMDGGPAPARCTLTARVRATRHARWLAFAGGVLRGRRGEDAVNVERFAAEQPGFTVTGLPSHRLPYWIDFGVELGGKVEEEASLYVVPRLNRVISQLALLGAALAATYISWLLVSLAHDRLPDGLVKMAATATGIVSPLVAVFGPLLSTRLRRLAFDAAWTLLLASFGALIAAGVLAVQNPLYIENNAPSLLDVVRDGKHVLVDPGSTVVVARDQIDKELQDYIDCLKSDAAGETGEDCALGDRHWFKAANYCLRVPGLTDDSCLELRSPNWLARLQRWLAFGDTIRVGCDAESNLDPEYVEEWKRSGSCKRDPDLKLTRALAEHLERTKSANQPGVPATCELRGEVDIRPFRGQPDATSEELRTIDFYWSDAAAVSLPSWRFSSKDKIQEVRLPGDAHSGCETPYGPTCEPNLPADDTRRKQCAVLNAPSGQISATVERGDQTLGTLWCAAASTRIFATRMKSHLLTFRILSGSEVTSRYEPVAAGLGEWVFWCESEEPQEAKTAGDGRVLAEAVLASDWQPLHGWTWPIPERSRLAKLDIQVREHGFWGHLDCPLSPGRELKLVEDRAGAGRQFTSATRGGSVWTRYSETQLYPSWVWFCDSPSPGKDQTLNVSLRGGGNGTLALDGTFTESTGVPCLIDEVRKVSLGRLDPALYTEEGKRAFSARKVLTKWPQPPCDPNRSYLSGIEQFRKDARSMRRETSL